MVPRRPPLLTGACARQSVRRAASLVLGRVQGVLVTSRGTGQFTLESATIAGVPVPKTVLQTLVSHYSRSQDNPDGIGLDDPFALPAAIREIRVEPGRALVVQ